MDPVRGSRTLFFSDSPTTPRPAFGRRVSTPPLQPSATDRETVSFGTQLQAQPTHVPILPEEKPAERPWAAAPDHMFTKPNGPLFALDQEAPTPTERPTIHDMYHDVGLYRSKTTDEVVGDTLRILSSNKIVGHSQKGAQVSANAGPTNWFESAVTLRIKQTPDEVGGLLPDSNSPRQANWYGTFSRAPIDLDARRLEVLVNGDTPEEVSEMETRMRGELAAKGLGHIPVVPIGNFLQQRFHEIARHLPEGERETFVQDMSSSPFWTQKQVGELAGNMGDAAFANWRQTVVPRLYQEGHDTIQKSVARSGKPEEGDELASRFLRDASHLSEGEMLTLAHRLTQPYTYAIYSVIDGYQLYGNGIQNALQTQPSG